MSGTHTWSVSVNPGALSFDGYPTCPVKLEKIYTNVAITTKIKNATGVNQPCVKLLYVFYKMGGGVYGQAYGQGKAIASGTTVTYTEYFKFVNPWDENLTAAGTSVDPIKIKMPDNSTDWDSTTAGVTCKINCVQFAGTPPACSGTGSAVATDYVYWGPVGGESLALGLWGGRASIDSTTTYLSGTVTEGSINQIVSLVMKNTGRCSVIPCPGGDDERKLKFKVKQFIDAAYGGETDPISCNIEGIPGCTAGIGTAIPGFTDITRHIFATAPSATYSGGKWYLGIKVWGNLEPEPAWGQGTLLIGPFGLNTTQIILGLLAAGGIVALLWYTKKKKMW
jgi:hypothetical protein